jgi:cyclopropane-fatty-acyl-phospholipid synthase
MRILPWLLRGRIREGSLTLIGPDGYSETFTEGAPGPEVAIHISDASFDWKFLLNPELRLPEAYMDAKLEIVSGELRDLLMVMHLNRRHLIAGPVVAAWRNLALALRRIHQNNTPLRSRRNASAHYDLGNDLYRLFLDADMQYSCAYFPRGDETLEEAQLAKKRHIAAKLTLRPGQRVLDIGCGWGGMALYLAQVADVEVLGVTLAEEQLKVACERAEAAGLADRVRFELQDYRKVRGDFDRIVSVGMFEHVGAAQFETFFATVRDLLSPDGVALLHSIMVMEPPSATGPFVRKYIFPGGYVPALSETLGALETTGLWLLDCEIWRKHYGFTLREWSRRFAANRDEAKAMYDERFCRMWELYLAGAESNFLADTMANMQLQLGLKRDAVPLSRDYLASETARLAEREARLFAPQVEEEEIRALQRRRARSI